MKTCINRRNFLLNSTGAILIGVRSLDTIGGDASLTNMRRSFIQCGHINQTNLRNFYHSANKNK